MRTVMRGRAYDRLVATTDGVVAVSLTIMVLPVTQIAGPGPDETMADVLGAHAPLLAAFVVTFFVVAMLWKAHHRIVDGLDAYDGPLFWLSIGWAATIALLPWPIALVEADPTGAFVPTLYFAIATLNTGILSATDAYVGRHPDLRPEGQPAPGHARRSLVFTGACAAATVLSAVAPRSWWLGMGVLLVLALGYGTLVRRPRGGTRP